MNEVLIDGIKYIPVTEVTQIQMGKIREVLEAQGYLSRSAIDQILKGFKAEPKKTKTKKTKKVQKWKNYSTSTKKSFKYNSLHKKLFNIGKVMENGGILYKRGNNPAKWNIQQAIQIRDSMPDDSTKDMTYNDVIKIEKRVKLSKELIRKIMYNIEYGNLVDYINEWKLKYIDNYDNNHRPKPLQNNPQKRKEEGYGWLV